MRARKRLLATLFGSLLVLAACGSATTEGAGPKVAASPSPTPSANGDTRPAATPGAENGASAPAAGRSDLASVDWATVDLATIDWPNIDLSRVDWSAVSDNPTAAGLDQETLDLIQAGLDPGSATLVVGDQTFEFDNFLCAFGHAATDSDVYSFSSNSLGEAEGVRVQLQADIRDESGRGRYEGPDLTHEVHINDLEDPGNPTIDLEMNAPEGIVIDGNAVTAEGTFHDGLTRRDLPGSLTATCGDRSRR